MFSRSISEQSDRQNQSFGSPKEKMLRNSNIFKEEGVTCRYLCEKHPNKKAKYYANNDRNQMFCSKCALSMALQGLRIEETPTGEEYMRKSRLLSFTTQLCNLINICEEKSKVLLANQNSTKMAYNVQKDRCNLYFDIMITKLSQLKQQYLSKLSTTFTNQLQESQSIGILMKSSDSQLRQFLSDIEQNVENIVKKMEMKPFEDIMSRYEKKAEEHQTVIQSMNAVLPINEIMSLSRELIELRISQMCDKILMQMNSKDSKPQGLLQPSVDSSNDYRFFETLEGDEIYQSTCSNSIQRSQSNIKINKPTHSPMRLPPFPKSQSQLSHNQSNFSRKDSGANTPDSSKGMSKRVSMAQCVPILATNEDANTNQKSIMKQQYLNPSDPISRESPDRSNLYYNSEKPTGGPLNSIALQLKIGLNQLRDVDNIMYAKDQQKVKTPKHMKQQSYQPPINTQSSLLNSQCKNSSEQKALQMWSQSSNVYTDNQQSHSTLKNKSIEGNSIYNSASSGLTMQRKMQANKRSLSKGQITQNECSKSEGKRQLIMPQVVGNDLCKENGEETLKDRIFKELSGAGNGGDSIYNQVLKINQNKQQRFIKEKENLLTHEFASLRKNTFLNGVMKK